VSEHPQTQPQPHTHTHRHRHRHTRTRTDTDTDTASQTNVSYTISRGLQGSILVAVNPYQFFDIYGIDVVRKYEGQLIGTQPPHIFGALRPSTLAVC
jgi:hypothetical protein